MNTSLASLGEKKKLAIARFQAGDLSVARDLCNEFCTDDASDPSMWCLLACIHGRTNRYEEAVRCANKSVEINPSYDAAWVVLGDALLALKRPNDATTAYERALGVNSGNVDALCGQCKVFEMRHDLDNAGKLIDTALQRQPAHAEANLYAAILEHRNGDLESSRSRLVRLLGKQPADSTALRAYSELGQILEQLGRYDDAYNAYKAGNRIQAREYEHTSADKGRLYQWIERHRDALQREGISEWKTCVNDDGLPDPVFLVGFPRSGTTLAEQLMASHPQVQVSNETPLLRKVISSMSGRPGQQEGYPYNLGRLDQSEVRNLRAHYWELADTQLGIKQHNGLFVDKLPLNILFIPAIHRLFPNARILFALRDPRDVCFSCYTNLFSANDAMANFTDIMDTARFYAATMDIWQTYQHEIPLNVYELQYETLVSRFEQTAHELIAFLGLEWDDNVLDYYLEKNQRNITTPSYQGITSPVYKRAIGRWQHYAEQLHPALTILRPYVRRFGYETEMSN